MKITKTFIAIFLSASVLLFSCAAKDSIVQANMLSDKQRLFCEQKCISLVDPV